MNLTALKISPEMLRLIAEIDEIKGKVSKPKPFTNRIFNVQHLLRGE
jgi:hypothetical protein